jgi:hypothetical protein
VTPQTHGCGAGRSRLVEEIEEILRRRLGWNEIMMSNIMWRFIDVNVEEFLSRGINPHMWLYALNGLSAEDPYWLGVYYGDLYVRWQGRSATIVLHTTNTIDAIYFMILMRTIATPSVELIWSRNQLSVYYRVTLERWPWHDVDPNIISSFSISDVLKFFVGLLDTDGSIDVTYIKQRNRKGEFKRRLEVRIFACKQKECADFLYYIRDVIYEKLGIEGDVLLRKEDSELRYMGRHGAELLKYIRQYIAHPLKRLRSEIYLKYYDGELNWREFDHLYIPLKYDSNIHSDPKRGKAVEILTQAAPQTHTHGDKIKPKHKPKN